jgi:hypothetical protein
LKKNLEQVPDLERLTAEPFQIFHKKSKSRPLKSGTNVFAKKGKKSRKLNYGSHPAFFDLFLLKVGMRATRLIYALCDSRDGNSRFAWW